MAITDERYEEIRGFTKRMAALEAARSGMEDVLNYTFPENEQLGKEYDNLDQAFETVIVREAEILVGKENKKPTLGEMSMSVNVKMPDGFTESVEELSEKVAAAMGLEEKLAAVPEAKTEIRAHLKTQPYNARPSIEALRKIEKDFGCKVSLIEIG